jgi:uncharacterized protein
MNKPMTLTRSLLLLLVPAVLAKWAVADEAPVAYPRHVIENSELRVLPTNENGRSYQLHIRVPDSFAQHPERRYPVLFVTDAYWDFALIASSYGALVYDKVVPEFIIVGLGYAGEKLKHDELRLWELSPLPVKPGSTATGHAKKFLHSLEHEIIPFVEREYRADPNQRVLAGSSLGGLFTLYAMYTRPALFQGYIASSPAVAFGNDWVIGQAREFAKSGKRIDARLYVTGAEYEWAGYLAGVKRYQQLLPTLQHPGLVFENRIIDGERHAGTKAEAYNRGIRFVFAPLAPESGPSTD